MKPILEIWRPDWKCKVEKISDEAKAARMPLPPEQLVGTLEDRPHREPGIVRAAKSVKIPNKWDLYT